MKYAKRNGDPKVKCLLVTKRVLGDLGNAGLSGVKKGASEPSGAQLKHTPAGARYPVHVARERYESILAGWIPPEYRVPRQ